jgi:hypothetical protein
LELAQNRDPQLKKELLNYASKYNQNTFMGEEKTDDLFATTIK